MSLSVCPFETYNYHGQDSSKSPPSKLSPPHCCLLLVVSVQKHASSYNPLLRIFHNWKRTCYSKHCLTYSKLFKLCFRQLSPISYFKLLKTCRADYSFKCQKAFLSFSYGPFPPEPAAAMWWPNLYMINNNTNPI